MNVVEVERAKYRDTWALPEYSRHSPGLKAAPIAHKALHMQAGESLIDCGCGTGRASRWFADNGLDVLAIDFVDARDVEGRNDYAFEMGVLWEGALPYSDYAYSADVLEHIPLSHIDDTLKAMCEATDQGFHQIAHYKSKDWGTGTLHHIVEPADWWRARLENVYSSVTLLNYDTATKTSQWLSA